MIDKSEFVSELMDCATVSHKRKEGKTVKSERRSMKSQHLLPPVTHPQPVRNLQIGILIKGTDVNIQVLEQVEQLKKSNQIQNKITIKV